jgi:hypothetical protein
MAGQDNLNNPGGFVKERGYPGQISDLNVNYTMSRISETASSPGIDYGVVVARSATSDKNVKAWSADGDKPLGFSIRYAMRPYDPSSNQVSYALNETVAVAKMGSMFVTAVEATIEGDQVLALTAQAGRLGSITGGAAAAGRVVIPGARWAETSAAGSLSRIEFNLIGVI